MIRKVVRESVITGHLANHTVRDCELLNFDLLDEDVLQVKDDNEMND